MQLHKPLSIVMIIFFLMLYVSSAPSAYTATHDFGTKGPAPDIFIDSVVGSLNITSILYGDANGDGTVDVSDAVVMLRYVVGLEDLSPEAVKAANVDGSTDIAGNPTLDVTDAVLVLRYTVGLISSFPVEDCLASLKVFQNTRLPTDYLKLTIVDNNYLRVEGATLSDNSWVLVSVSTAGKHVFEISPDRRYGGNIELSLAAGNHTVGVYMNTERWGSFRGYDTGIPLVVNNGEAYFPTSTMLKHNAEKLAANQLNIVEQTRINVRNKEEEDVIRALANDITTGETGDYSKVFAISDWVSKNIYYDYDALRSGNYGPTDAYGTLQAKRSVCQGYAELTTALIRSLGIQCKLVIGHAIWVGIDSWDTVNHNVSNHAWNEVYVDGRWIIIDTTWNSFNKYENGEYRYGGVRCKYFDPTIEAFSHSHKIIK